MRDVVAGKRLLLVVADVYSLLLDENRSRRQRAHLVHKPFGDLVKEPRSWAKALQQPVVCMLLARICEGRNILPPPVSGQPPLLRLPFLSCLWYQNLQRKLCTSS